MREVERKALLDEISKMAENLLPLPEYGSKVERLMRDITGESMERLAMVKVQLGMYLAEVTQKAKETFVIKEELLQLRHCLSRCVFCEVGELEKRIDELVAEPIVAKEELNALAQEVKMVEEREEEIARSVRETQ
ncbi:MAG TPA: hypothetical protein PKZ70_08360, partial [Candidatus Atribacteria bacterium]|nr:hypothetical protein [Candidatus Atribacteria bacterium]